MFVLLLGVFTLLCSSEGKLVFSRTEATSIACYNCERFHLGFCYDGMKTCYLKYQQRCAIENIYVLTPKGETKYFYSKLSCMYNCDDINFLDYEKKTELICCKHSNYCNIPTGN
ncbi:prostate and testis expressed protein 2 [Echinops telfairi]|uniref:Prostate and testis expressed protein 2 n=1 Tax=Echinops telfairi TaxID=9371 RepID=A0ABM1VMY8_ECHTE|nr:prostate and testis expressed protein 2 [Echinops telfairi]